MNIKHYIHVMNGYHILMSSPVPIKVCVIYTKFFFFLTSNNVEEEKKMNATYIISIARKLGCSIFLLPEDIIEVI